MLVNELRTRMNNMNKVIDMLPSNWDISDVYIFIKSGSSESDVPNIVVSPNVEQCDDNNVYQGKKVIEFVNFVTTHGLSLSMNNTVTYQEYVAIAEDYNCKITMFIH